MDARVSNRPRVSGVVATPRHGTQILSVVCAITGREPDICPTLMELYGEVANIGVPVELVVVLNGPDPDVAKRLRSLAACCERIQIYVTGRPVDRSTALIAGFDNSIGDWVATIDPEADDPVVVRALLESAIREQAEVVLSVPVKGRRSLFDRLISRVFHTAFRLLHGFNLSGEAPSARLLARSVVNSVLRDEAPLIAFETLTARARYHRCLVQSSQKKAARRNFGERVRVRWRTLIGVDAAPLRLANLLAGISTVGALSYSFFVVLIYLCRRDVVPGWASLSLLLSTIFTTLALVLWLLSEYMLLLLDPAARRPQYEITDEFGGQTKSLNELLNVETEV